MPNVEKEFAKGKPIYVGIDVHKRDCLPAVRQGFITLPTVGS